jgi:hypothetical protein
MKRKLLDVDALIFAAFITLICAWGLPSTTTSSISRIEPVVILNHK